MHSDLIQIAEDSVKGGFFLVLGTLTSTVVAAVSAIIVARLLGPELYGQYALSIVIPQLLFLFAGFGISQGVIKFAASYRAEGKIGKAARIVKYATLARTISGLAFFLFNFAFADLLAGFLLSRPDLGFYVRISSLTIFFQVLSTSATSAFLGLDIVQYSAFTSIIERTSKAIMSVLLVVMGFSVVGALLGHVAGWIVASVFAISTLLIVVRKFTNDDEDSIGLIETAKTLTSYGMPLYWSGIIGGLIPSLQSIILAMFVANIDIGNLKAANNFMALVAIVSVPIATILFPAFSKLNRANTSKIRTFFKFANKYTTLLVIPIATALIIFSREIVQIVYGSTYETAALFLSFSSLLYFLVGFGSLSLSSLFNGLGETRTTLTTTVITLVVLLGLSPILTSTFGVLGLLYALLSASVAGLVYGIHAARSKFRIVFDIKAILKIYAVGLISTIPPLALLQISPLPILVNVIVGGLLYLFIYLSAIPVARAVNRSELERAYEIAEKSKLLSLFIKPLVRYEQAILNLLESTKNQPRFRILNRESAILVAKTVTIVFATIAVFRQDLALLFSDALQSETSSHILVIPFIFLYLVYRKRKMLGASASLQNTSSSKEAKHLSTIIGVLLSIIAIMIYWYGSYAFNPLEYHIFALPIFVAGLTLILFNPQTLRQLIFPIAILYFLTPPPSQLLSNIGATLSIISSEASNILVNLLGVPSTLTSEYGNPTLTIIRPDGAIATFMVDIACSGIYSLIGFLIFGVFIAYIIRDKLWKKIAIFIIGFPLIYLLNILRISTTVLIGYHYGQELALQIFHLLGGWILIFLGTLILLTVSDKILKTRMFVRPQPKCEVPRLQQSANHDFCLNCGRILKAKQPKLSKADIAKITAIGLSVILLFMIQTPVFALADAPPIIVVNTPSGQQYSTGIFPEVPQYNLDFYYRDTVFEERANIDMALVYLYSSRNSSELIWATMEIASSLSRLHTWEKCLITWPITHGYQPKVTQIDLQDVQILNNPPIVGRHFVFKYTSTNQTQAVLYWYETMRFEVNSTSQEKHVKISLIAYPKMSDDLSSLQSQLEAIAMNVADYWQPIRTWSQVSLLLSQNGNQLAAVTSLILFSVIIFGALHWRRENKNNLRTYEKLSISKRQLIDAIHQTGEKNLPTLKNIGVTYRKVAGQRIKEATLLQEITEMEKVGILERIIVNKIDEPTVSWRTRIAFQKK